MKRLILLVLMMLGAVAAKGQIWYYDSLEECGNDPLKYIEHNYEDYAPVYSGVTMDTFVKSCELELGDFIPVIKYRGRGVSEYMVNKIIGIYLDFYYKDNSGDYLYSVPIWFSYPYPYTDEDLRTISSKTVYELWGDKFYQFFKDYKIQYIGKVLKHKDGKSLKDYRRP